MATTIKIECDRYYLHYVEYGEDERYLDRYEPKEGYGLFKVEATYAKSLPSSTYYVIAKNKKEAKINCCYKVYYGVWDDDGELLWDSVKDGLLTEDDSIAQMKITYVTVDTNTAEIVIEVG